MSAERRDVVDDGSDVVTVDDLATVQVVDHRGPGRYENTARCPDCGTLLFPTDVDEGDVVECIGCHVNLRVGNILKVSG